MGISAVQALKGSGNKLEMELELPTIPRICQRRTGTIKSRLFKQGSTFKKSLCTSTRRCHHRLLSYPAHGSRAKSQKSRCRGVARLPPELTGLCQIKNNWAQRFESYINGIEICNAFAELSDLESNQKLFEKINRERQADQLEPIPIDTAFLNDLSAGLPACSGNALGFDRLLAVFLGQDSIKGFLPFCEDL